jgi:hypothetical protein
MNRAPLLVLLATGGLLIAGPLIIVFSASGHGTTSVKVVFESTDEAAPAGPEPLFPGQP